MATVAEQGGKLSLACSMYFHGRIGINDRRRGFGFAMHMMADGARGGGGVLRSQTGSYAGRDAPLRRLPARVISLGAAVGVSCRQAAVGCGPRIRMGACRHP